MTLEQIKKYETPAHKIRAFLAEELAIPPETINLTARLRQDLKLDGTEAAELLELFSLVFDIDISGFRINDYFSEGTMISPLLSGFLWVFGNGRPLKTLRVSDLVHAFDKGKLG
ncbi:MAG: hypothetical protein CO093_01230 [Alphaproteobacteria bacterium CG_4_9_14_3_um_filter_47_13]|nr:MAG: hypothetical protein CO093_01230 [Alphaproteobacteria bacterium CG_4_9_14_3_um_filter_47_13]